MSAKPILIACVVCLLAACSAPVPETIVASPTPTEFPTLTSTPSPTARHTPTPTPTATPVPYRAIVRARGKVICGVDPTRPDYSDSEANFDVDICRALAAALFDNPDAIEARPLDGPAAVAALQASEIDVYFGPTDRDLPGLHIGPTLFIDATGAIARTDVGIRTIADLKFATVCLIQDSIDERLFNEAAAAARVEVQPFLFNADDSDEMVKTYDQGRCDAVVDNRVRLVQRLPELSDPRGQGLIDLTLIIGLRGPITSVSDANWTEIVAAVSHSLIRAEELGVASSNLEAALDSDDPAVRQLLGVEGHIGTSLGLVKRFVTRIIAHVGNYGEIYDRHYGAEAGLDLPRGPNALLKEDGLIAAP